MTLADKHFGPSGGSLVSLSSFAATSAPPNTSVSSASKATIQQAKGFALAMTKMAFTGELEDVTDTVMANWRYL